MQSDNACPSREYSSSYSRVPGTRLINGSASTALDDACPSPWWDDTMPPSTPCCLRDEIFHSTTTINLTLRWRQRRRELKLKWKKLRTFKTKQAKCRHNVRLSSPPSYTYSPTATLTLTFDLLNWKLVHRILVPGRTFAPIYFFSTIFCLKVRRTGDRRTGKTRYAAC